MECRLARVVISTMRPALADIFTAVSVLNSSILEEGHTNRALMNEKNRTKRGHKKNPTTRRKGISGKMQCCRSTRSSSTSTKRTSCRVSRHQSECSVQRSAAGPPGAPQPTKRTACRVSRHQSECSVHRSVPWACCRPSFAQPRPPNAYLGWLS